MERTILHCDLNNFYASVEYMLDPSLRSKAVAVGGDVEERHGIILAKNYKAKAFGVQTGEALWQAKQKCPNLVIVPPHYEEYMKYSALARSVYQEYTDQVEPYGMDECWLDVTGSTKLFGDGETIANEIRERMKFELGLTVSVMLPWKTVLSTVRCDKIAEPTQAAKYPRLAGSLIRCLQVGAFYVLFLDLSAVLFKGNLV